MEELTEQQKAQIEEAEEFIYMNYALSEKEVFSLMWNFEGGNLWVSSLNERMKVKFKGVSCLTNNHFSWKVVAGNFDCSNAKNLESLEGGPTEVGGSYCCSGCQYLSNLLGAPHIVKGDFDCSSCMVLESLVGGPLFVDGNFNCSFCLCLKDLKGSPKRVGGNLNCSYCSNLHHLQGISKFVGGCLQFFGTDQLAKMEEKPLHVGELIDNNIINDFTECIKDFQMDMIAVEGGTFQMGATVEQGCDALDDEHPAHIVNLSTFYLSKTEITQAQFQALVGKNPSSRKGDNLPVENVSWDEAHVFCEKLSKLTGKQYALPTEAQWEYAARGGKYKNNTKYAGSNNADEVAWHYDNSNGQTHPVATKSPNALGFYDMSGNVWEWCADWYSDYSPEAQTNPTGPEIGGSHVIRGGCWRYCAESIRVTRRKVEEYYEDVGMIGFRVALLPKFLGMF